MATKESKESSPLLSTSQEVVLEEGGERFLSSQESSSLYWNFVTMSVAFSFNHGCVVSCLAYATTELGNDLGGAGSGALYVCYALTAFLVSKPVVSMIGPKNGLIAGVAGYCIYIVGFLLALLVPALAWPVFMVACSIGGIAGGLLWTSQGRYFARNAKLYSSATQLSVEKVNATFAGIFAIAYLGLEMVTKILATLVFIGYPDSASKLIFSIYTVISVLAAAAILSLSNLDELGTWDFKLETVMSNVGSTGLLVYEDPRLALLLPFQVAFGFASSFVPYYVFGTVIAGSDTLGDTYVGLLSAVIVFTGTVMAMPAAWAANKIGKPALMVVGGLCLTLTGLTFFVFSDETLGTWSYIVPFLVVYGMGRGTWENTNKAVVADLFPDMPEFSTAAFAAISFSNGLAASIGYFTFSHVSREQMASLVALWSGAAILCYLGSNYLDKSSRNSVAERLSKYNSP